MHCVVHNLYHCNVTPISRKSHFLTSMKVSSSQEETRTSLFHPGLDVVRKGDHAHRLPNAETNAWSDTTVEAADAVLPVDETKSIENR